MFGFLQIGSSFSPTVKKKETQENISAKIEMFATVDLVQLQLGRTAIISGIYGKH